jgi:hypothetical protein
MCSMIYVRVYPCMNAAELERKSDSENKVNLTVTGHRSGAVSAQIQLIIRVDSPFTISDPRGQLV